MRAAALVFVLATTLLARAEQRQIPAGLPDVDKLLGDAYSKATSYNGPQHPPSEYVRLRVRTGVVSTV